MTIAYKFPANGCQMLPAAERPAETSNICKVNPWDDEDLALILRARLYLNSRYRFRRNSITGRCGAGLLTAQDVYDELMALNPELMGTFCEGKFGFQLKHNGYVQLRTSESRR